MSYFAFGKSQSLSAWSREYGISRNKLSYWLDRGMKLEEIILLAKEETKLTRMQRVIVSELTDGAKTTTQISRVLYNDDNESAKRAVWVHICHLRKRDVKIVKRSGTYVLTGGEGDAQ